MSYQGMTAFIQGIFNVYNNAVLELLEVAAHQSGLQGLTQGYDPAGAIGTMMVTERCSHPLWVVFPYGFKLPFQNPASGRMRRGYHYPECILVGPIRHEGLGTVAKEEGLQWQALRGLGPTTARGKALILYDENIATLPPPN